MRIRDLLNHLKDVFMVTKKSTKLRMACKISYISMFLFSDFYSEIVLRISVIKVKFETLQKKASHSCLQPGKISTLTKNPNLRKADLKQNTFNEKFHIS